ncbi:APC family permease [Hoyosella altamirensis]|uniref:Amino acid transporter n=2 Tax=Hoyosella altamirensis TaxID=616997 RepID=A0A839RK05_9ACTN|nr:APC family permease [Hoyosella altamirensis]MBB3036456.1 amino acid transporter [Hoyosella altamirensis]
MSSSGGAGLVRVLGRWDVLAVAFGAMIGFGWIVLTGGFLEDAGTLGAALAFVIGGIIVSLVGLTYAELVSAMPEAGGEHNYVLRGLGSWPAFLTSWTLVLGYVAVCAFEAVALPHSLKYLVPQLDTGYLWTIADYDVYAVWAAVGIGGGLAMAILNYVGVRPAAIFQSIAVVFLIAVGATLLVGSFTGGDPGNMQPLFATGFSGILVVLIAVPFLFVGFDIIPQSAGEIRLPYKMIGILLIISVALAAAWYILIILTVGSSLPADQLAGADLAAADGMSALWNSQTMGNILVLGGIAGILTSWNGFLIGGSRLIYAMAESGMLPRWFAKVHPRFHTPSNAIIFITALTVIAPLFGRQTLIWLVGAGGFAIVVAYIMVAITFLVLRRREPGMERPFRVGPARTVGVLAVVLAIGLLVLFLPGMPGGLSVPEWIVLAIWGVLGLVLLTRVPRITHGPDAEERIRAATNRQHHASTIKS